jgi:hypothetical protein
MLASAILDRRQLLRGGASLGALLLQVRRGLRRRPVAAACCAFPSIRPLRSSIRC